MHPYLCFERKHCGRWKRLGTLRWPQCQSCGCLTNFDAMHQNKQKIDCNRGGRSFCCTGSELTPPPIFASMQNTHLDSSDLFPANVLDVLCTRDSELLVWPTSGTSSGMSQSSSFGNPRQSTHCNVFWQLRAKLIHYSTVGCHERLLLQEMRCLSPDRMTFLGKELTFKGSNKCASIKLKSYPRGPSLQSIQYILETPVVRSCTQVFPALCREVAIQVSRS